DAESIREVAKAKAEGESVVIEQVFKAMKDADIDDNMLALKSMEALEKVAQGKSTKLVLPSDAVNFLGTFKGIKEVMKDDDDIKININNKEESQE
ncbi:MAG: peptidase, partial [Intestinibacter bartlettii]